MKILLVILILLALLCFLKMGGRVEYGADGIRAQIRLGLIYYTVFPRPQKPQKKKKKKKASAKAKAKPKQEKKQELSTLQKLLKMSKKYAGQAGDYLSGGSGGELGVILDALPELFAILGDTISRIIVEEMTVHYTIPGRYDAAGAAIQYGMVYTTGGAVSALMDQYLTVKKRSIGALVDFNEEKAKVYVCLNLAYRFGDLVIIAIHVLKEGLILLKGWRRAKAADNEQSISNQSTDDM